MSGVSFYHHQKQSGVRMVTGRAVEHTFGTKTRQRVAVEQKIMKIDMMTKAASC